MTPEPDRMAQEIVRALRRIMRSMDISSRKLIAAHGLSIPQLLCLQHLREFGPLTSGALAKTMALSPPTVTGILTAWKCAACCIVSAAPKTNGG